MMNSVKETMESPERSDWNNALNEELYTIVRNGTCKSGFEYPGVPLLPTCVILKIKIDSLGLPARFKSRLVVRRNFQDEVLDYRELHSPVACI